MTNRQKVVHMLVTTIDPKEGGMEQAAPRIAELIGSLDQTKVHLYTRSMQVPEKLPKLSGRKYELVNMQPEVQALYPSDPVTGEPLLSMGKQLESLFDTLVFRNSVAQRMHESPNDDHVMMSFYLVGSGFLAQHIADELQVRHIACVRGS